MQHQDGNSHVLALPVPNLRAYDPAFAYELAVIIEDGIRRMYKNGESIFYYITVMNENYAMPPMPAERATKAFSRACTSYRAATNPESRSSARSFSAAARFFAKRSRRRKFSTEKYGVAADVWSVTSYKDLYMRWHRSRALEPPASQKRSRAFLTSPMPRKVRQASSSPPPTI